MNITITTNITATVDNILNGLFKLTDRDYLLRPVALETILNMKDRIHTKGQDSSEKQIGTYSNGYLALRKKSGRGGDTKIIVSFTRQLENDWAVLATEKGYGIGFNNPFNTKKARWVEENKDVKIFNLTPSEQEYILDRLNELTINALDS